MFLLVGITQWSSIVCSHVLHRIHHFVIKKKYIYNVVANRESLYYEKEVVACVSFSVGRCKDLYEKCPQVQKRVCKGAQKGHSRA